MATHGQDGAVWLDWETPTGERLGEDRECDVCVVGAGIAGLLTADRLQREGRRVIVLEKDRMLRGETGRTTAHFVTALDDRYEALERWHGAEGVRLAAESHAVAVDYAERLCQELNVGEAWARVDGYLVVNERHRGRAAELLERERAAAARAEVAAAVEVVERLPGPWPSELGPALRFTRQARAHPLKLLGAVAAHFMARGGRIFEQARAAEIHGGADARVITEHGRTVRCGHVVVATNTPVNDRLVIHTKQSGYQTYVIAARVPRGVLPDLLLWDGLWEDDESYRYVRLAEAGAGDEHELLIVGGEDHKTGQGPEGEEPYRRLEQWTRAHFPMSGAVERRWSGEVMEPVDGLGYIGRNPGDADNVYVVTGDSGTGMTHGTLAALILPDLIAGRQNQWAALYDPARKVGWRVMGEYARENANTLAQYRDWLSRGDVKEEAEIRAGEGAIVVRGVRRVAVYKNENGTCSRLDATCPHLGGVVRWNGLERTWDCPCHASRFSKEGRLMHGPASSDLKALDERSGHSRQEES